ncbi:hypothetical protein RB9266 [Rhodopirellula baltica SH 1]|uniref:Uncharacterized protein n=1 Tax=Rhodopirellula baltica (strain DSM 10527 / NCIMB 13988 / SH1) TaxID=243090 RepID=Q7ULV2_RHOBA|nr:hypothetical protein RB9266 [Rhodopirellula baltica SH 1]
MIRVARTHHQYPNAVKATCFHGVFSLLPNVESRMRGAFTLIRGTTKDGLNRLFRFRWRVAETPQESGGRCSLSTNVTYLSADQFRSSARFSVGEHNRLSERSTETAGYAKHDQAHSTRRRSLRPERRTDSIR